MGSSVYMNGKLLFGVGMAEIYDPELRSVLELATDEELFELESILYGPRHAIIVA